MSTDVTPDAAERRARAFLAVLSPNGVYTDGRRAIARDVLSLADALRAAEARAVAAEARLRAMDLASAALAERAALVAWRRALMLRENAENNERLNRSSMSPLRADHHRRLAAEAEAVFVAARDAASNVASASGLRTYRAEAARRVKMVDDGELAARVVAFASDPTAATSEGASAPIAADDAGSWSDAWKRCTAAEVELNTATKRRR